MSYKIVLSSGSGEIVEKKSRFIGEIVPVESEEEALNFIAAKKKQYYDARHNCSAYVIGENNELMRQSDDGEPGGTAGRPMLDILINEGLHNCCVVVTRYFGGVLLGTGGLVRAYQGATQEAIEAASIAEPVAGVLAEVRCDYNDLGKLQYLFGENGITIYDSVYESDVVLKVAIPAELTEQMGAAVSDKTSGRSSLEIVDEVRFAMVEGKLRVF